eukprot:658414_1
MVIGCFVHPRVSDLHVPPITINAIQQSQLGVYLWRGHLIFNWKDINRFKYCDCVTVWIGSLQIGHLFIDPFSWLNANNSEIHWEQNACCDVQTNTAFFIRCKHIGHSNN